MKFDLPKSEIFPEERILSYSCLRNPMDENTTTTVHGVKEIWTTEQLLTLQISK